MIQKYLFGAHVETGAVVVPVETGDVLPYFSAAQEGKERVFTAALAPDDVVYGLGQSVGKIDKRGKTYVHYNVDNTRHRPDTLSLYGSHNFLIVDGETVRGFFFDCPGRVVFDVGDTSPDTLRVQCQGGVTVYAVDGPTAADVTGQFLNAIGRSYLPPRWAFGFGQSRWGYKSEKDIRRVAEGYRRAGLPLDWVCLDIDYMKDFRDFTVDPARFPDFPGFVREMRQRGVRLVPIVDAGIKIEPGDPVYEEGIKEGYFCMTPQGKPFEAAVWPGMTHFPDFLQPRVRAWFGEKYRFYTGQGIEGFWNDMNEPSIFYTAESQGTRAPDVLPGEEGPYQKGVRLCDYKRFTHQADGRTVSHHEVHNLYGYRMTQAAGEGLDKLLGRRYLLFSRSSYIGAHRYGGIWTGDNTASWENLRMLVRQMPSLHMCGFLYSGSDIGGFAGCPSRELMLRWLAFAVFTPLMRNHCAKDSPPRECYRFRGRRDFESILSLRYRLLPYLYSEYMKAALRYQPMIRPLGFDFPGDSRARQCDDQLLVGDSVMIAPILKKGTVTRRVYLPKDMLQVTYGHGAFSEAPVKRGFQVIRAELGQVVFFIREGKAVPVGTACGSTDELDASSLRLLGGGCYELYWDDGETKDVGEKYLRLLRQENCPG